MSRNDKLKPEYVAALWAKWPTPEQWPARMDCYEAAAYLRVSYLTIWRRCKKDRSGRAALRHQRLPDIRVEKADLDNLGLVQAR